MAKVFGVPILAAIVLGILFPYTAISLIPFSILFLAILMINAGLVVDWRETVAVFSRVREVALGLLLLFVAFPLVLWILARLLVSDQQYLYGFVFSSLCPVALVAPYFTRLHEADEQLSFLLMVSSMVLCPLIVPVVLAMLFSSAVSLNLIPLMRYMVLLVTAPLLLSIVVGRFLPGVRRGILRFGHVINMVSLSLLIFTLFGSIRGRVGLYYTDTAEIVVLFALVLLQDFGVLIAARRMLGGVVPDKVADALSISLSMRNVAIAAGVLLVYDPRASFVPALAFVAHALLFNFLGIPGLSRFRSR